MDHPGVNRPVLQLAGGIGQTGDAREEQSLAQEAHACIQQAVDALPAAQRAVISLRDIVGWTSDEVCQYLDITETNQRVLLHRAIEGLAGSGTIHGATAIRRDAAGWSV